MSTVTERHDYIYASGKLLRETVTTTEGDTSTTETLDFFYDANGTPYALKVNGTTYYYVTNLQGDVVQLVNSSGATVASYEYDPYGNIVSQSGDLAEINPLRYRSYYFDSESGFYYLQSRYYDPAIGRFINADSFASTGQGILGYNMFAYCGNNPINFSDGNGKIPVALIVVAGGVAVSLVTGISNGITSENAGGDFWTGFGIGAAAGGVGYALSVATKNPLPLVGIRSIVSFGTNLATTYANNGKVTAEDWGKISVDAVMDGLFSTITYFYNPFSSLTSPGGQFLSNGFNALVDGVVDVVESWLFGD